MLNVVDENEYYGNGFLDNFVPERYTPAMAELLKQAGSEIITNAILVRTPLNSMLTKMLNGLSGGEYSRQIRKNGYDAYYHLALNITTEKGAQYVIEKNEALNFMRGRSRAKNSDVQSVPGFPRITIGQLYEKTRQRQGAKYFQYNASSNNCQQFISDVLQSNGISDPAIIAWVRQDTESLFKNRPMFRKLANTVTDMAAIGNAAMQGHAFAKRRVERFVEKNKVGKKIRKFFGGAIINKMKVAELKAIIKSNKSAFGRKILVSKMRKADLLALVGELHDKGIEA